MNTATPPAPRQPSGSEIALAFLVVLLALAAGGWLWAGR